MIFYSICWLNYRRSSSLSSSSSKAMIIGSKKLEALQRPTFKMKFNELEQQQHSDTFLMLLLLSILPESVDIFPIMKQFV